MLKYVYVLLCVSIVFQSCLWAVWLSQSNSQVLLAAFDVFFTMLKDGFATLRMRDRPLPVSEGRAHVLT